jgi:hypothetical protein
MHVRAKAVLSLKLVKVTWIPVTGLLAVFWIVTTSNAGFAADADPDGIVRLPVAVTRLDCAPLESPPINPVTKA